MRKRLFRAVGILLAIVMIGSVLTSCGTKQPEASTSASAPPPASGDSSASSAPASPAGDGKVFVVDAAYAAGEPVTQSWTGALEEIVRRSDGRIKVNHYYAGSLLTFPEIPVGMRDGVAQWAYLPTVNYVDIFPLSCRIMQLPFMGLQDPIEATEIYMQLFDEFPQIAEEMAQYNMIPLSASPLWGYHLHLIDKNEVRLPSDLSGRKLVPYKTELQSMLDKFNVSSSYIPPGQMYESLERSVIDGYINCWAFANWFGLHGFLNQHVTAGDNGFFQEFFIYVVAKDFFESMPEDLQKIWYDVHRYEKIEAFGNEYGYEFMWDETRSFIDWQINYAKENNHLFVELTPEEIEVWKDEMAYTHQLTLDEINEQRGDQVATAVYNRARELIMEKYGS